MPTGEIRIMVRSEKWKSTVIPRRLALETKKFLESETGQKLGFTNPSMIVATALREYLERHGHEFFEIKTDWESTE